MPNHNLQVRIGLLLSISGLVLAILLVLQYLGLLPWSGSISLAIAFTAVVATGLAIYFMASRLQRYVYYLEGSLDALELPVTTTDVNMKWVFINKVTESLLALQNLDKKSCLGKHCSNWKADICGTDKCGVESLRDGRPRTNYNQEYPDAPSTLMQVDTTYITDPKGKVLGHVEVVTNIDTTRRLDETLSNVAATLEQTSAALEQMSGLTKQNAEASGEANQMMKEADQTVSQANSAMDGLTNSMRSLSEASQETGKIIKTIDEIAFQTNLLALNAAVEAARAGEAGAGFAVVADEVRNLAMRAAEAAKNTASLIEDTIRRIDEGSSLVEQTNQTFGGMVESINKAAQMLEGITNASQEQSLGIEEINRAVANLENVISGGGSQAAINIQKERHAEGETRLLESGF